MIEVPISDKMFIKAREKAIEMGKLNNSIQNGGGSLGGFIGEFIAQKVLGGRVKNTYEYDLRLKDGSTVDVKTKMTSVEPLPHYDCSIANYNTKQDCDYYAFVRVLNNYEKGWFLGWIKKEEYFNKARELKKGDRDGDNGFLVKSDCWNLRIDELEEFKKERDVFL